MLFLFLPASGPQGEVILFKSPLDDSCLFINRLHRDTTEVELREAFAPFGLLHDLRLYETDSDDRPCAWATAVASRRRRGSAVAHRVAVRVRVVS